MTFREALADPRRMRLRQTRAAAGPDAALRILAVDPDSRVPERRLALAPWEP
jgi:protein ImuB